MLALLRKVARPLFTYIQDPTYRTFLKHLSRARRAPRFQPRRIRLCKAPFHIVDYLSFAYQYEEIFHQNSYAFLAPDQPHIIDCGANVGTSVLYFAKRYPHAHIMAFEADPKVFDALKTNVSHHALPCIELVNKAVWIDDKDVVFHQEGADGGSIQGHTPKETDRINVESVRLKTVLENYPSEIDLLKIDIEGAEVAVLKDCQHVLAKVRHLFVEYHAFHGQPQQLDSVLSILSASGYRYYLSTINQRTTPLIPPVQDHAMDLQVNIFAYRV